MRTFWLDFRLAFRNIVRQKRRSTIAIVRYCIWHHCPELGGRLQWTLWNFRETTIKSQLGHLQIVRPGYHDAGKADPYSFLLPGAMPELEAANEPKHIKAVAPRLSFAGLMSHGESTLSFIGDGNDARSQAVFGNALQISAGMNLSPDDPLGIIIGEGLARNLGVGVGDRVVLLANTASRGTNAVEVTIRGLFSTVTKSYDDNALRMPVDTARQLLRTQGSHIWIVLLNDAAQTDIVLGKLRVKLRLVSLDLPSHHTPVMS